MSLYIPKYFSLSELCHTDLRYEQNIPDFVHILNLSTLCEHLLDPLRELVDSPIYVNSGFRSLELNRIVGGVNTSFHIHGKAADIRSDFFRPEVLFEKIKDNFVFTELGLYYSFVHVAYDASHLDCETFVKL